MVEVVNAAIVGFGETVFISETPAAPKTTEVTGSVTVHNHGHPGIAAHFRAMFAIRGTITNGGIGRDFLFQLPCIVLQKDPRASYATIESEAVRQLAPILRSVADQIEAQVAESDAARAAKE